VAAEAMVQEVGERLRQAQQHRQLIGVSETRIEPSTAVKVPMRTAVFITS
jgi:hypothetical protein